MEDKAWPGDCLQPDIDRGIRLARKAEQRKLDEIRFFHDAFTLATTNGQLVDVSEDDEEADEGGGEYYITLAQLMDLLEKHQKQTI